MPVLYSLVNMVMDAWDEAGCLLCQEGKPINTDVGHGREFFARKGVMVKRCLKHSARRDRDYEKYF